ncbi:MAG: hypothetical protein IPK13_28020 [Deltaproteobacteria bacterium]|nr:hypothetical protein [Deltaproteobacteria bacterium]
MTPLPFRTILQDEEDWRCKTMQGFGEALGGTFEIQSRAFKFLALTMLPHPGLRIDFDGDPRTRLSLSWPWSLPFGPASATIVKKRMCSDDWVDRFVPNRLVFEPGVVIGDRETVFMRSGYRFLWHPATSRIGVGAGVGSTVEVRGHDGLRASLSPEALLQFGACCRPVYATLSLRYDYFFTGQSHHSLLVSLGLSYF